MKQESKQKVNVDVTNTILFQFYHACDANHVYQLCILEYGTLAFCDFFGSVLSFYAVLVVNAKIPEAARTFLLMSGAMLIATFQNEDRHSDLSHILPLAVAGAIMLGSWVSSVVHFFRTSCLVMNWARL